MEASVMLDAEPRASSAPLFAAAELGHTQAFGGFQFILGRGFTTHLVPHVHPYYVIGVVDEGSVEITVRGETYLATPGSVVTLRPFEPHTEIAPGAGGWSFRYLYPTEAVVREALGSHQQFREAALQLERPVIQDEHLARLIAEAHLYLSVQRSLESTEPLLATLFARVRKHCSVRPVSKRGQQTVRSLNAARQFMIETAPRRVRVSDLARAAGLSEFHFNRLFREVVGLSVYAFFDRVRIARAHELLFLGHAPSQVAHMLEYADQPHFTRHFMRASCLAPRQFSTLGDHRGAWTQMVHASRPRAAG